jgi:DNA-binding GntR family transcriptional regulator
MLSIAFVIQSLWRTVPQLVICRREDRLMTSHTPIPVREQIARALRGRLLAREWPGGTRLKEQQLAVEYGVSRGPIRDALLTLTKEGFLRMLPNRGASVCGAPSDRTRDIYLRTRRQIECLALREGFRHWRPGDLRGLERILHQFRAAAEAEDLPAVIEQDLAFHLFLVQRHPDEDLTVVWMPLMSTISLPYSRHRTLTDSYHEHVAIHAALQAGKPAEAGRLLKEHIQ